MRLSYKLNIGGTWVEVGSFKEDGSTNAGIVNSANTVIQNDYCTVDGKSVTNSASFQLTWRNKDLYTQIVDGILDAVEKQTNVEVVITDVDASEVLFTGKVDLSKVSISSGMIPESFSISCTDYIVALDEKINANIVYEDAYVREIIENLLGRVYSEVALDAEVIYSITVGYFVVTTEDSFTYRDVIDTMLYERCQAFLYRNPATDSFEVRKVPFNYADTDISHQVHYLVGDKLITETKKWDKDGIVVTFPTVAALSDAPLYVADLGTSWDEETGSVIGTTVAPNGFWPENGELTATYQEFNKNLLDKPYQEGVAKLQNSDIDLLFVREGTLRVSVLPSTGWDQPAVDLIGKPEGLQSYPRKAWFLMRNTSGADMNLLMVSMKGDAVYKERMNKLIMPPLCKNPEEYETSYIFNTSEAQYFANYVTNFARLSQTTAAWVEFEKKTNVGDIVIVKQKGASISQAYYVVSQQMTSRIGTEMQYKYIAIAISGYEAHESYVDTTVISKNPGIVISDAEQYYYSTSKTELTGGEWLDDPVAGMEDKFLWKRRRIEYSMGLIKVTTPYFAGGQDGKDGKDGADGKDGFSTIIEWCLSSSSTVFTEANKLRLYEYDSSFMLWDTYPLSNSSLWQRTKPQPTTELPYIWERVSEDSGATWSEPYCISTNPFSSITLEASQLAYKILATGYVLEAQSIAVSCKKMFTSEPCYWIVKKGSETIKISNVNTIAIDIPVGATYRFVDVTCICDGKSRSLRIIGEAEALPTYQKLSTININDLASTTTRDDGSPLIVGDYRLVLSGEYHLPYVWNGTSWKGASTTDSNYGHVVSSLAPDVWASDQTIPSVSAIYGFYKSLFSSSLLANTLTVGSNQFLEQLAQNQGLLESIGSDATVGTQLASNTSLINNESFKQAMAQNPLIASVLLENPSFIQSIVTTAIVVATTDFSCAFGSVEGVPTFDIAYGGNTIFRIDPSTGRVFIGKPNSTLDGAETGFMYDPSTQSISSKNNKLIISSDGRIIATDGQFAGEIYASSGQFTGTINSSTGFFGGHLDTPSFSALPSTAGTEYNFSLGSTVADQTSNLLNIRYSLNLGDGMYRVNLSADSTVKYMEYKIRTWNLGSTTTTKASATFYTSEMSLVGRIEGLLYEPSSSTWDGVPLTLDIFLGAGDVFVFKDIPRNPSSTDINLMETGQVYSDSTGTLKIKL